MQRFLLSEFFNKINVFFVSVKCLLLKYGYFSDRIIRQYVEIANVGLRIFSNSHFIWPQNSPVIGQISNFSWRSYSARIRGCMGSLS